MKYSVLVVSVLIALNFSTAQTFTKSESLSSALTDVGFSNIAWGDYDQDGDEDLVINGISNAGNTCEIYRNEGGTLLNIEAEIAPFYGGSMDWGDFDGDGDLDLLITGMSDNGPLSIIYQNTNGVFQDVEANLIPIGQTGYSDARWGDYDADGDLDIAMSGSNIDFENDAYIYRNDNGVFVDTETNLEQIAGTVHWVDYDLDGDLDLSISGDGYFNIEARLYQYNNGTFTDTEFAFIGLTNAYQDWADYDGDGDPDLLISGQTVDLEVVCHIYRNDISNFINIEAPISGTLFGSVQWGDFDADDDLDILIAGDTTGQGTSIARIYENIDGTFYALSEEFPLTYYGEVKWADYDNDFDLDVLITGLSEEFSAPFSEFWVNSTDPNFGPDSLHLSNLKVNLSAEENTLIGDLSSHDLNASDVLTFSLVYDAQVYGIYNGAFHISENQLYVNNTRNMWAGTFPIIIGVSDGELTLTDTFNIQVVDDIIPIDEFVLDSANSAILPNLFFSEADWGDYDGDGDMDLVITGTPATTSIYRNDEGVFTNIEAGLEMAEDGPVKWGDFDGDGDLDLAVGGSSKIYRNNEGTFVDIEANIVEVSSGAMAWGDYDGDGDLDLALSGITASSDKISKIYRNDDGIFVDTDSPLTGVSYGDLAWGDYDNDGDLDLALSGDGRFILYTIIYLNTDNTFSETISLEGLSESALNWGDYDNDGDLDLLAAGRNIDLTPRTIIYQNQNNTFVDTEAILPGVSFGHAEWGDYDHDGDLDILLVGDTGNSEYISTVLRNDGDGFTDTQAYLPQVTFGVAKWADVDGDSDLDVLVTGLNEISSDFALTQYWLNTINPNRSPSALRLSDTIVLQSSGENTQVGLLSTEDADADNLHTYTLIEGEGSTHNSLFKIQENALIILNAHLAAGEYFIRIQVSDSGGGTFENTLVVAVIDDVPPILIPSDTLFYLDPTGAVTLTANNIAGESYDPYSGTITMSMERGNFYCEDVGPQEVSIWATDAHGNTTSEQVTISIADTLSPKVQDGALTLYLNAAGAAIITSDQSMALVSDNCGIMSTSVSQSEFSCENLGTQEITVTTEDHSGNSTQAPIQVTLLDTLAPIASLKTATVELKADGLTTMTFADLDNGSLDNCGIESSILSKDTFTCEDLGENQITITLEDASGNVTTATTLVTVTDPAAPVAHLKELTLSLNDLGTVTISSEDIDDGSTDNCGIESSILSKDTFTCEDLGENEITITLEDASGNVTTATTLVTVTDLAAPVAHLKELTLSLNDLGTVTISSEDIDDGSTDNCGIESFILSKNTFTCEDLGENEITITLEDASGNVTTATTLVTVTDQMAPAAHLKELTLDLNDLGTATISSEDIDDGSTDNCGIESFILSKDTFTCEDLGENEITVTLEDASGNVTTATTLVTVTDQMAPAAHLKELTLDLNDLGTVTITSEDIDDGSTDNCGIENFVLSKDTFTCDDLGNNEVVITLTDKDGNTTVGSTIVTILDRTAPTAILQGLTIQLDPLGTAILTPEAVDNGSSDNCGLDQIKLSKETFGCDDIGTQEITVTLTDLSGNETSEVVNIIVVGNCDPLHMVGELEMSIWPNPADQLLRVSLRKDYISHTLRLSDVSGKTIASFPISQELMELDISALNPGIYFISIQGRGAQLIKFIKR